MNITKQTFLNELKNNNKMFVEFTNDLIEQGYFKPKLCYDLKNCFITKQFLINILFHDISIKK